MEGKLHTKVSSAAHPSFPFIQLSFELVIDWDTAGTEILMAYLADCHSINSWGLGSIPTKVSRLKLLATLTN